MILTLDLFRENGCVTVYADGMPQNGFTFPCFPPWKACKLESPAEEEAFSAFLTKLAYFLKGEYKEDILYAVFLVPFDFSFLRKKKLIQIANGLGIGKCRCGYGIEYQAFFHSEKEGAVFFGQIESDRIEFGAAELGDGVCEIRGISGIRLDRDDRTDKARARLDAEVKQFLKELGTEDGRKEIEFLYIFGNTFDKAVEWLEEAFDRTPIIMRNDATKGAMKRAGSLYGWITDELLLQVVPFSFSLALGENGERGVVIPRYTVYPTKRSIRLLVSTETTLHIYEGNYLNPRFDTEIGSVSLAQIPEGHEAECTLDLDAQGIILLTVRNEQKKILMEKYLHELN